MLTIDDIDAWTGGRLGVHDVACPWCGPDRRSPLNQRRKVLRLWRAEPGFATFHCARCGEAGHVAERPTASLARPLGRAAAPSRAIAHAPASASQRAPHEAGGRHTPVPSAGGGAGELPAMASNGPKTALRRPLDGLGDVGAATARATTDGATTGRAAARAAMAAAQAAATARRMALARWLWARREPASGTIVERYLRDVRGFGGRLPDTLAMLPGFRDHPPAMIAAFGFAEEPEPGLISVPEYLLAGIHLTKLAPDGSGKAGTEVDRVMIGYSKGSPIVLAPMNDLLGLAIVEGIEKGLAVHEATGLGVWVAGAAARMPSLADHVPDYVSCVTIFADDDKDGRRHAATMAARLVDRGLYVDPIIF
jgi:hypothetical protein